MKNGKWVTWVLVIITYLAMGIFISADIDVMIENGLSYLGYLALIYLFLFVTIYLDVFIHEAGHLLFGLLTGYKFSSFRVFSRLWMRDESGRLCMKRYKLPGTAGQCLMEPPELVDGKMPTGLYNRGGSIV